MPANRPRKDEADQVRAVRRRVARVRVANASDGEAPRPIRTPRAGGSFRLVMLLDAVGKAHPRVLAFAEDGDGGRRELRVGKGAQRDRHELRLGIAQVKDRRSAARTEHEPRDATRPCTFVGPARSLDAHVCGPESCLRGEGAAAAPLTVEAVADGNAQWFASRGDGEVATAAGRHACVQVGLRGLRVATGRTGAASAGAPSRPRFRSDRTRRCRPAARRSLPRTPVRAAGRLPAIRAVTRLGWRSRGSSHGVPASLRGPTHRHPAAPGPQDTMIDATAITCAPPATIHDASRQALKPAPKAPSLYR